MIANQDIRCYASKIAKLFNPEKVILFGSYAEGCASDDSDVDLLVVMEHEGRDIEQAFLIRRSIPRTFPLDLVVRTPERINKNLKGHDSFLKTIFQKGKTLYERRG
jgi:predicted nucleotidyltransferase